jgi:hypothetical protein
VRLAADIGSPDRLACIVEGNHAGAAEKHIHLLAVGGWRAGGITVQRLESSILLFRQLGRHFARPDNAAAGAIETNQVPRKRGLIAGIPLVEAVAAVTRQKDLVFPSDGTRCPMARQFRFPMDPFAGAPGDGQVLVRRLGFALGATKLWPIGRHGGAGKHDYNDQGG